MSILSGRTIDAAVNAGLIKIDPYHREHLNPASIDLTLGDKVAIYAGDAYLREVRLDAKREPTCIISQFGALELKPGTLYLLHTAERVSTDAYVPVLDGKSSIGRLGICVHLTAGYGDPGFDGQYTLEVTSMYRVRVYSGMRFCQMRFHRFDDSGVVDNYSGEGPVRYEGNYSGDHSQGPVPSMAWKQFRR